MSGSDLPVPVDLADVKGQKQNVSKMDPVASSVMQPMTVPAVPTDLQDAAPSLVTHPPILQTAHSMMIVSLASRPRTPAKAFQDGPSLPSEEKGPQHFMGVALRTDVAEQTQQFPVKAAITQPHLNVEQPSDSFVEGKVLRTTAGGVDDMLKKLCEVQGSPLAQGCIIDSDIVPIDGKYQKGEEYKVFGRIGKGSFGQVDLCEDQYTKKINALKQVPMNKFRQNEVRVPIKLDHINVVKVKGILLLQTQEGCTIQILQEYAGMSLREYWARRNCAKIASDTLSARIWVLCVQGLAGLAYLHLHGIIHLDIKRDGKFVCTGSWCPMILKIVDFGTAKLSFEPLKFSGLTAAYMAPELCKLYLRRRCGVVVCGKVDVYALGLSVMFMYKGYHILDELIKKACGQMTNDQKQTALMQQVAGEPDLMKRMMCDECDIDMRELLQYMTYFLPRDRITAEEAFNQAKQKLLKMQTRQHQMVVKPRHMKPPVEPWPPQQSQQPIQTKGRGISWLPASIVQTQGTFEPPASQIQTQATNRHPTSLVQAQGPYGHGPASPNGLPVSNAPTQSTYRLPVGHTLTLENYQLSTSNAQCTTGLPGRQPLPTTIQDLPPESRKTQAKMWTLQKLQQKLNSKMTPYTSTKPAKQQLTKRVADHSNTIANSKMMHPVERDDGRIAVSNGGTMKTGLQQPIRPGDVDGAAFRTTKPVEDFEIRDGIPGPNLNMRDGGKQEYKKQEWTRCMTGSTDDMVQATQAGDTMMADMDQF